KANPVESYAARFAGKEAVGKALGCGVYFTWREIEIVGRPKPAVRLSGRTAAFAEKVRAGAIDLSMTHSRELAAAICVVVPANEELRAAVLGRRDAGRGGGVSGLSGHDGRADGARRPRGRRRSAQALPAGARADRRVRRRLERRRRADRGARSPRWRLG